MNLTTTLNKVRQLANQSDFARQVEFFLKMSEEMAAETVGEVDSA